MPRRPASKQEIRKATRPPGEPETVPSHHYKDELLKSYNGTTFENDPTVIKVLAAGIERGLPPRLAAVQAGIGWRTFDRWRQMAKLGHEKYQFIEQVIRSSQSKFADTCIQQIVRAGLKGVGSKDPDWKALMRLLESLEPDAFKPRVDVTQSNEQEFEARRLLDLVRQEVGTEVAERIIQRYLAEGGEGLPGVATGTEGRAGEDRTSP